MRTVVRKWGNSGAVRIPCALLRAVDLAMNQPVELREESGCIVIVPSRRKEYRLSDLVKGITRANRHKEAEFGRPVGREAW